MKIFNWVHHRFHHRDGFGNYVKKTECFENESEKQALLKNMALALSIGTFGFDPLEDLLDPKTEHSVLEDKVVVGELNSLAVGDDDDKVEMDGDDENVQEGDFMMTVDGRVVCPYNKMKKGERITLYDLFLADSSCTNGEEDAKIRPKPVKKPDPDSKDGVSFSKKPSVALAQDSHILKKIQRLIKRMKKRKIHPDIEGKLMVNKEGTVTITTPTVLACFKAPIGPNQSVSLLQTQDGPISV